MRQQRHCKLGFSECCISRLGYMTGSNVTSDGIRIIKYLSIRQNLEIENMTKMISDYMKEHINPDGLKSTDEILNKLHHETNYKGHN